MNWWIWNLKSGRKYTIKLKSVETPEFVVQLETDPNDPATKDDKYVLYSTDDNKSYSCTFTPQDDQIKDDTFITLHYKGLKRNLNYTLEVDPGAEGDKYCLFENIPYRDLKQG